MSFCVPLISNVDNGDVDFNGRRIVKAAVIFIALLYVISLSLFPLLGGFGAVTYSGCRPGQICFAA